MACCAQPEHLAEHNFSLSACCVLCWSPQLFLSLAHLINIYTIILDGTSSQRKLAGKTGITAMTDRQRDSHGKKLTKEKHHENKLL
jgi:hypothetical protein